MLGRPADSTVGVLFVLAFAVAGTAVLPAFAVAGSGTQPAAAAVDAAGSGCPAAGVATGGFAGSNAGDGPVASGTASGHSLASYPEAPQLDVARGDIAAIETGIANGRTGTVRIESVGGEFNVSLTFANNDGRKPATLYVNTYLAGNDSAVANFAYTAGDNDRVAVADRGSVTGTPMPVGAYDVTVETASGTTTQRMTIDEPEVGDLTLLRAPGDRFEELDTDEDIAAARESGLISEPTPTGDGPEAALGDTMVYRLNASGFYGLMAAQGGATSEANFLTATGEDGAFDLSITSSGDCESAVDVAGSVGDGTARVIPDPSNETVYVTADLRRVASQPDDEGALRGPGRATYAFAGGTHVVESNTTTAVDYAVADRTYSYDSDAGILVRSADSGQRVAGETNLAPGTNLTIEVTGLDRDYDASARTTVDDDGTFGVDVDLSDAPNESRFTASIAQIANSQTLLTTGSAEATAVLFEQYESPSSSEADRVENARVALEDGGFLAVYLVPPDEQVTRGNLIGRSGYLDPGVHDPTVSLDRPLTDSANVVLVAHRDDDGDERFDYPADDSPYRIGDDPVYGVGRVLLDGDNSTPPRSPQYLGVTLPPAEAITGTPAPTATSTDEPTPTATPSPTPTATESDEAVGTTELPPPTLRRTDTPTATPVPNGTAVGTTGPNGTVEPNGTAANGTATVTDGATDGLGPGFGVTVVVVAVVLFGAVALSRRE
ncbi:hypothetical protein C475_12370 [Halosimplex carlsbadense 2-9-1]|uniref:PGF-CTERM sorting domain-containing protein n=1 Tax=Halosimplex carlsbadense 2-9-1 TaxID=797114 RepID=M0CRQ2_9EURY|nr:BGTF surface domain-containing protein [Halosimplex carlsbadense]ELZ24534.1 hypothetical protein C475_12370 [Halosimplex carlsbadense 2-9-1]